MALHVTRPPYCPTCGGEATATSSRSDDRMGVATAYYVCDNTHLWSVRWMTEVAG